MRFDEKIRLLIEKLGDTNLVYLAQESGIPYSTLITYVNGISKKEPPVSRGIALAKALNVDIQWLFNDSEGLPAPKYVPPISNRVSNQFEERVSWDKIEQAISYCKHVQICRHIARVAARMASQGRIEESRTVQEYLILKKGLMKAVKKGKYEEALSLREKIMHLQSEHQVIQEIAGTSIAIFRSFIDRDIPKSGGNKNE